MKTQMDMKARVVALSNLEAMCRRESGMCHRFWIESVSANRVKVGYSNPDEYGSEDHMFAFYPCYPNGIHGEKNNPCVVLDLLRVERDHEDATGWQNFDFLVEMPTLWRNPDDDTWKTKEEIEKEK